MIRREVIIGDCRLLLGDALAVIPTLARASACVTDPPYGINAKLGMGGGTKGDGGMWKGVRIAGDLNVAARDAALQLADAPFAAFAKVNTAPVPGTRCTVVWDKGEHTGAGDLSLPWKPSFELVFVGGAGWSWSRRGGGIVKFNAIAGCVANRNDGHRFHPFEKPVDLMQHFCERAPVGTILDPFMGSGSTLLACVRLGRPAIGIEINEEYFETAVKRVSDAADRPDMFIARDPEPKQEAMEL